MVLDHRFLLIASGVLLSTLTGAGCRPDADLSTKGGPPPSYPYKIVASCGMVADIARQVAGEHAEVVSLMKEGVDPHLYRPTREDITVLMNSDLVLTVGLNLEGRMAEAFERVARTGIPVHPVTADLDESLLLSSPSFAGFGDPHVWMDVSLWSLCVESLTERLAEFDPRHAAEYRANAVEFRAELARLHEFTKQAIASIPEQHRVLITAHDAFEYYSRAYGIPVKAVQGLSTESEAGVDDVNRLVDFIVARGIPAIFVESSVNREGINAILEGVASRGGNVRIGGELYSDAMGPAGTYEGTYPGMIEHNTTTIVRALGGSAPEKGLKRQLTTAHE
jgi:manganese/zinc/iron transport system substrate-binding protein